MKHWNSRIPLDNNLKKTPPVVISSVCGKHFYLIYIYLHASYDWVCNKVLERRDIFYQSVFSSTVSHSMARGVKAEGCCSPGLGFEWVGLPEDRNELSGSQVGQ